MWAGWDVGGRMWGGPPCALCDERSSRPARPSAGQGGAAQLCLQVAGGGAPRLAPRLHLGSSRRISGRQVAVPYFVSLHMRGLLPPEWRFVPLFVSLDIAHNVTTAFFLQAPHLPHLPHLPPHTPHTPLPSRRSRRAAAASPQTLKFHGFISATTFSFAFNATAYAANAVVAYYFLHAKVDLVALLPNLALSVVNLAFVYRKRGDPRFVQVRVPPPSTLHRPPPASRPSATHGPTRAHPDPTPSLSASSSALRSS